MANFHILMSLKWENSRLFGFCDGRGGAVGGAEWPISQQTDPKLTSGDKIVNSPRIKITAAALTQIWTQIWQKIQTRASQISQIVLVLCAAQILVPSQNQDKMKNVPTNFK